ncbi:two-component system OmpR family sensor kinase [Mobiluncus mulieris]|uniref:histidine kinase n=1 Tax=Mobiluncus mulieris TaxID=2052 RepID=A0A8G2HTN2_9ACTO|nr:HAMP domain-containing sensor histidine kinase [Mobiluncus mulieris]MBB5847399.1 two-component system OmpR family sensor kinase [Mobiluncus mulieris]SPX70598.1 Probable sensor histidine kinase TcrY [Mobiluncus mulieris]STO16156.1 Probable sensor histidine kinase TcrY [Mobiluncus mulieris]
MRAPTKTWNSLALTTRLTVLFALSMLIALATGGIVTIVSLSTYLTNQQDAQLSAAARVLGPNAANLEDYSQLYKMLPNDYYVYVHFMKSFNKPDREFVTDTTKREAGVPTFSSLPTEKDIPAIATSSSLIMPGTTVPSTKEGQNWRILSIMLTQNKKVAGAVTVGLSMAPQKNMIQALTITVMISTLIIAMVGTFLSNILVGRAFRPLHQIESVANKIAAGDLSKRIPPAPTTTEVGSLSNSLNIMLSHLEQAFSAVELSERKMRRFVSDASHELRTPTAAIRGYAELYRMGGVEPERQAEVMARIESEATRMGNMVQDLLTLARLDERRPMVFERTDLTAIARNALSDQTVIDPERPVALLNLGNESIEDVLPVYAVVDSEKISQVIANLLSNVRQHTPPRTAVEIAVGYRMWPDEMGRNLRVSEASKIPAYQRCAVIEVRDHGLGVDPENAEKVFERFFRADASRVRTTGGTGLGLAIVSGIVSAHNGTVAMLTTPGGGATVRIKLPCQAPHVPAESTMHTRSKPTPPPPPPPPPNT